MRDCATGDASASTIRGVSGRRPLVADALRQAQQARRARGRPEFTGRALDQWATANGVRLVLIQPGKPTQNAYVESFNGKFRDECLNENWFTSVDHARAVISTWRRDYNEVRPHSTIGDLTPAEFARRLRESGQLSQKSESSGKLATPGSTK